MLKIFKRRNSIKILKKQKKNVQIIKSKNYSVKVYYFNKWFEFCSKKVVKSYKQEWGISINSHMKRQELKYYQQNMYKRLTEIIKNMKL